MLGSPAAAPRHSLTHVEEFVYVQLVSACRGAQGPGFPSISETSARKLVASAARKWDRDNDRRYCFGEGMEGSFEGHFSRLTRAVADQGLLEFGLGPEGVTLRLPCPLEEAQQIARRCSHFGHLLLL